MWATNLRRLLVVALSASLTLPVFAQVKIFARRIVAASTPAFVQDDVNVTPCDGTGATTIAAVFGSNVTAGSAIVVAYTGGGDVCRDGGAGPPDGNEAYVTDTRGNTYTFVQHSYDGTNNSCGGVAYALNTSAGANTVTVTFGASIGYRGVIVTEYSNIATSSAADGSAVAESEPGTASAWSSGAIVPGTSGDLIFTYGVSTSGAAASSVPAGSFIERQDLASLCGMVTQDQVQVSAASIAGEGTWNTATNWIAIVLALKAL